MIHRGGDMERTQEAMGTLDQNLDKHFSRKKEEIVGKNQKTIDSIFSKADERAAHMVMKQAGRYHVHQTEYPDEAEEGYQSQDEEKCGFFKTVYDTVRKGIATTAAIAAVGYAANFGIAMQDGMSPFEEISPMKQFVVEPGYTIERMAEEMGIPQEKIIGAYQETLGSDFDPSTDVHVGDKISAVGYGDLSGASVER